MRVLITGAAGFIGSHLVDRLLAENHEVAGLDNFNSFYPEATKRRNLEGGMSHPRFVLFEGDLRDEGLLAHALRSFQPDGILHMAAMPGVRASIRNPGLCYDVNIRGTLNLLEQCRIQEVRHILFASSSSVYGRNPDIPFRETTRVDQPISPYAASKRAGEITCYTYHHLHGMSVACLRLFTVYGPRQRPDLAIHKFTQLIESGRPIPFFGDGTTRRDYTFIDDAVSGVLQALDWVTRPGAEQYDTFNLGQSRSISLRELVEQLETAIGKRATLHRLPEQPGDVPVTSADISHSRATLGYSPQVSMAEGLRRFVEWYRSQPSP